MEYGGVPPISDQESRPGPRDPLYSRPSPVRRAADGHGHAVVLGAGIAGLLAARVLSETFGRVTVLERDVLLDGDSRRGAPQGRHLHGLLDRGRQIIEELFPGLTTELTERGASTIETLVGSRWYLRGLRVRSTPTGLISILASRGLLEDVLRTRLRKIPGVEFVERTSAAGLVAAPDAPDRIIGVRVARSSRAVGDEGPRPTDPGADEVDLTRADPVRTQLIYADLVVDATGRASRGPDWLAALDLPRPPEQRIDVDLGYASRFYRYRPGHLDDYRSIIISTMPGFRGGGAVALEGDRWHITLAGMLGDHPPTDPAGFEAFARTLPVPDIYDIVTSTEALSDPVPHRFSGSLRRHYERLKNPPEGFLTIGDAVCSFNPLYAQGMTVAAQQVRALQDCLRAGGPNLPARFYQQAAHLVDVAWDMANGADLRYPGVRGRRSLRNRLVGPYAERVQVAAHQDATVARALMSMLNLVDAPTVLLRPAVAAGVVRFGWAHPTTPRKVSTSAVQEAGVQEAETGTPGG
ncbi:NAD(P)/FAD-dependent oxidoreductase [Protofrankia symbiont of Coriaria ruscifolia]|uniref:NAD(P)/FAD-dependent oxidoreductase n=1 Tax=Protofrankia symbiont of Coriaria ruscifolia TaxID=1306542 RepID=UPI001A94B29C|nr:FAD-dependent oxidoreductase [Protofrankia symbiont of Coriaria ruscifolia]